MDKKRKVYAPFSLTSEAGVAQTPVEGYIDVNQTIYPTVNTGTINENGTWTGVKSSDSEFFGFTKGEGIANGGSFLTPDNGTELNIDMSGFSDLFIAVKTTRGGNYGLSAVMGPDTIRFANLQPVDAASPLRGTNVIGSNCDKLFTDTVEVLTADVWEIFYVGGAMLRDQKNMQMLITNNAGGDADIEVAFMRLI
tara:strand:+ start:112 stop:696 length:585 start_codon:yes stop_codon:yes gene_type:complete